MSPDLVKLIDSKEPLSMGAEEAIRWLNTLHPGGDIEAQDEAAIALVCAVLRQLGREDVIDAFFAAENRIRQRCYVGAGQHTVNYTTLWREFSEAQAANWLEQSPDAIKRFWEWLDGGKQPQDAWS